MNNTIYGVNGICEVIPPSQKGLATISHFEFNRDDDPISYFRSLRDDPIFRMVNGKYCRLHVNGNLMMSDTRMERITNKSFIDNATGNVLIAGLGIGLILHNILSKGSITSILVIEKYQDVIDLVSPHFPDSRIQIICADIFDWKPPKGHKFDTIYFDIWPNISVSNLEEIKLLHNRFKLFKTKDGWMNSWMKEYLQKQKRKNY